MSMEIDTDSIVWRRVRKHILNRIATLRDELETEVSPDRIRMKQGAVNELRKLLLTAEPPARMDRSEEDSETVPLY